MRVWSLRLAVHRHVLAHSHISMQVNSWPAAQRQQRQDQVPTRMPKPSSHAAAIEDRRVWRRLLNMMTASGRLAAVLKPGFEGQSLARSRHSEFTSRDNCVPFRWEAAASFKYTSVIDPPNRGRLSLVCSSRERLPSLSCAIHDGPAASSSRSMRALARPGVACGPSTT